LAGESYHSKQMKMQPMPTKKKQTTTTLQPL
jgi:hypothetical protein